MAGKSGINAYVTELFDRAGLAVEASGGKVTIYRGKAILGTGRNVPYAIQSVQAPVFMKYGQVFGLAMAYAFGPDGVAEAVCVLQEDAVRNILDGDADTDDDFDDVDEDDDDGLHEEDDEDDSDDDSDDEDEDAAYDDSEDIEEGRITFTEDDE
jgi:hypothetical protein